MQIICAPLRSPKCTISWARVWGAWWWLPPPWGHQARCHPDCPCSLATKPQEPQAWGAEAGRSSSCIRKENAADLGRDARVCVSLSAQTSAI